MAGNSGTTQGQAYASGQESTFGTDASTIRDSYMEGVPSSWPDAMHTEIPVNTVHRHFGERTPPIKHSPGRPDSMKMIQPIIRATADNGTSDLARYMEAAGCNLSTSTRGAISSYVDEGQWDIPTGAAAVGDVLIVELDSGIHYPVLVAAVSTGATDTITPAMALPSAASNGNTCYAAHRIMPQSDYLTKWETWRCSDRRLGDSNKGIQVDLNGCAVSSVDQIVLRPNEVPLIGLNWHVAKVTKIDIGGNGISDYTESYNDEPNRLPVSDNFVVAMANASASGDIARTNIDILEARINLGQTTVPIPGYGSASIGGWQGYEGIFDREVVGIELDVVYSKAYETAWELAGTDAGQTAKYIELCQPSTDADLPAYGFFFGKCHYVGPTTPDRSNFTDAHYKQTLRFQPRPPGYSSHTDNDEAGAAPWHWGINSVGSA